jgi:hypothetical protein
MPLRIRLLLLVSAAVNALFYGGHPDESLSARAWREREDPAWERRRVRIDQFFTRWQGPDHCRKVWADQVKREEARRAYQWQ